MFLILGQRFRQLYDHLEAQNNNNSSQKNVQRATKEFLRPYRTNQISETFTDSRYQQYSFQFHLLLLDHDDDEYNSNDNDADTIFLCHNTVATIFSTVAGLERAELLNGWLRHQERDRKWARTRTNAVHILEQIANVYPSQKKRIEWDKISLPLGVSTAQAAELASKFKLRKLLQEKHMFVAGTLEADVDVVRPVHGQVISLPDNILEDMPILRKAGNEVDLRNTQKWAKVRLESISTSYEGLLPNADPVRYQTLGLLEKKRHKPLRQAIDKLRNLFQNTLGATQIDLDYPAFLKTPTHAPQACHIDFTDEEFLKRSKGKVFLAFVPITCAGMHLQLWPIKNQPGRVLFIPYGKALCVPGDTIHGGGFLSCLLMHNLRLHFYIRINGCVFPKSQANHYLDETQFPQSDKLTAKDGGLLANFFEKKMTQTTKKRPSEEIERSSTKLKAKI